MAEALYVLSGLMVSILIASLMSAFVGNLGLLVVIGGTSLALMYYRHRRSK